MTGIEGLRVSVPRRLFVISLHMCPLRKMLCNIRHMWESFQKDHHILNTICMILYVAVVGVCRCEERQWVEGMILVVQIVELDLLLLRAVVLGTALTSAWFCRKTDCDDQGTQQISTGFETCVADSALRAVSRQKTLVVLRKSSCTVTRIISCQDLLCIN